MSTEFRSTATDEFAFLRWSGNADTGPGTAFEFGTMTNFETVAAAMRAGEQFEPLGGAPLDGDPLTASDLEALVVAGRVTFGVMPVTVDVGSGELFRFTVEG